MGAKNVDTSNNRIREYQGGFPSPFSQVIISVHQGWTLSTASLVLTFNIKYLNWRNVSNVTIVDVSWRQSFPVLRVISSVPLASRYNVWRGTKRILMTVICQMYQKNCSVCQGVINKDCVESSGKFYHANCMKVCCLIWDLQHDDGILIVARI